MTNVIWNDIKENKDMPLEKAVLVAHKYGIEFIMFSSARWRYCYTGDPIEPELLKNITHWCQPQPPSA